ncbi:hypothetical protein MA5_03210 [Rickettsia prowazekii str. GvV257]|uniref:cbb3-type cytochrome c oxidase subunit I n=1 Tax=Rickettsia prowazekii TaxID=782 RepID=UPI000256BD5E|nr:cbb3-type cytochrome c oxidase subunit I [Rickettsia prowazekii]AFE52818.1 hypothetical protein MA5_03210 [Rickettsia prowazekii str. GvV257]
MHSTNKSHNNSLANAWLKLGIISLGLGGLYSIILVVLRTPQLSSFFLNQRIFKSALIIHVNLSILIWLLSITASVWGNETSLRLVKRRGIFIPFGLLREIVTFYMFDRNDVLYIYPKLAFFATLLIAISPLAGYNTVTNNYIPMLANIVFILGLSLFGVTLLLYAINILYLFDWMKLNNLVNVTVFSTIIMFILSFVCFGWSYKSLQKIIQIIPIEIEFYYELLFWSGGHLLQFIYTQILIFIWVSLLRTITVRELKFQTFYLFILYLNFVFSILILFGHISYDIIDIAFKEFYTDHMKYLGGIAPILCLVGMVVELVLMSYRDKLVLLIYRLSTKSSKIKKDCITLSNHRTHSIIKTILLCSITLFLLGGLIAININDINLVIPAHYHGSIVGISIACMGYSYQTIIPLMDHDIHKTTKQYLITLSINWIKFAIYLLTFGQILHILGLAFSGIYGVMRKDPNSIVPMSSKLLMGMMGIGGLIAIVGGLMFVYICGKTMFFLKGMKLEYE